MCNNSSRNNRPKVARIKLLLISYILPESLVFNSTRVFLFLASLLLIAIVIPFNPYSHLNFLLFTILRSVYIITNL